MGEKEKREFQENVEEETKKDETEVETTTVAESVNEGEKELEEKTVEKVPNNEKKSKKKIVIPIIVVIVLIACGVGGYLVYNNVIVPNNKYEDAMKKIEDERYYEAVAILEELGDYKDAKEKILEAHYREGKHYAEIQEYDQAIEAFENAGDYQDAADKKEEVEEEKEFSELKEKFKRAYDECKSSRTRLSSDGLSITVDSKNQYDYDGMIDIVSILAVLDLPESLLTEMTSTNALMGRQTQTYNEIEVSWSYHPDNGLDAIFKIVE